MSGSRPGSSASRERRTLAHVGRACRAGAVELGLNGDHLRASGEPFATLVGPQVKWAHAIDERTSIGVVALAGWSTRSARYATAGVYVPLTVRLAEGVWLHANGGRDWFAEAPSTSRTGVALEWQAALRMVPDRRGIPPGELERRRVGVRWQPSASFSVDLSGPAVRGAIDWLLVDPRRELDLRALGAMSAPARSRFLYIASAESQR